MAANHCFVYQQQQQLLPLAMVHVQELEKLQFANAPAKFSTNCLSDQLMRTPLHFPAQTHSATCIELLLSKNTHIDLRVVEVPPLFSWKLCL
jgi:hypothetical protein